jgi:glycosyltransferase involved in cell wall biosynthesis
MMKTILLISRCPPYPLHLGDRLIIWHVARELRQRGYVIDLLAFANRPEDHHEIDPYRANFRHITLIDEPRRSQASYLKRMLLPGSRFPVKAAQSWSPPMWDAIAQHVRQNHYDLAHLFGGVQVYEYRHAIGDLPAIIVPYESYSLYLRRVLATNGGLLAQVQYQFAHSFESFMFTPYARTVVVSDKDRDELLHINPALNVDVIPNGIDLDYFQQQTIEREPATLLFTGNYEYAPNVDAALRLAREILPQVQAQSPEAKLWLVGNAPTPEMQTLASDSITVTGRVPDVRPYLTQATAFISPLRLGAGIKNKVLEALAMGCPLIATPLSVDGIAVTPGADALVADDNALVEQIIKLLRDTDLQQNLSTNGRKLIEAQYSWSHVADRYAALYEEVSRVRD